MKLTISLPDDLVEASRAHCEKNGYKLSTFIQHLLKVKMDSIQDRSLGEVPVVEKTLDQEIFPSDFPPTTPELDDEELEEILSAPEVGICITCYSKKPKLIKMVTYRDNDLIRQSNKLCVECIVKAKATGNFIGEGVVDG